MCALARAEQPLAAGAVSNRLRGRFAGKGDRWGMYHADLALIRSHRPQEGYQGDQAAPLVPLSLRSGSGPTLGCNRDPWGTLSQATT